MTRVFRLVSAIGLMACQQSDKGDTEALAQKIDRGRYLVNTVGACQFCHTPLNPDGTRDATRYLSGIDCFLRLPDPMDRDPTSPTLPELCMLSSRNLTNHSTGLQGRTDAQIKDALLNGVGSDGSVLHPDAVLAISRHDGRRC